MKRTILVLIVVTVLLLLLSAIAGADSEKSIHTILVEDGRFTTLLAAIEITDTEQAFSEGHWTLFAPTDEAFARLGLNAENIGDKLSLGETADLLLYQALDQAATTDDAKKMLGDVTMANGRPAGLKWYVDTLWVNDDSKVIEANIFAANGMIHVIDEVVTPPWPRTDEDPDDALLSAIKEAHLLEAGIDDGDAAETEASEAEVAEEVADDAAGEETAAEDGDANETDADETDMETDAESAEVTIPENSILDVMVKDGRFSTYLEAVGTLDLIEPYVEGEWTVFAPTDEAFARHDIDATNIADEYSVGELADLLLYHALDESVSFDKATTMVGDITMRNGQLAGLKILDDSLYVNDFAEVIDADLKAYNGVIHALDDIIERPWPRIEVIDLITTNPAQSGELE